MAAYSAVVTLEKTLKQLLHWGEVPPDLPKPQIQSLHKSVDSLKSILEEIAFVPKKWRPEMRKLETSIRDAIYSGQDKVEYLIKDASPERWEEISVKQIEDAIAAVADDAKQMADKIKQDPQTQNLFSANPQSTKSDYSRKEKIVGQQKDFEQINNWLDLNEKKLLLIPITGLPGMGKTTLARSIYNDQMVKTQFNVRAWVTVSQEYNNQEIFSKLLSSLESKNHPAGYYAAEGDERVLRDSLYKNLYNQRYLIVIDDIWQLRVWDTIKLALPDGNKSRVVFTTRIQQVADAMKESSGLLHKMDFLSPKDSWELFCHNVFGDAPCPSHLTKIGRRIATKCGGLPLSIILVGGLLSQEREKIEYWKRVEEDTGDVGSEGDSSFQDILSLSYNYLPANLKGCFLYFGAFPEDAEIRVSKLIKLWIAEGFLSKSTPDWDLDDVARDSLRGLANRNLILVHKVSSNGEMKTCGMHDSLRQLAESESRKDHFFYPTKKYVEKQEEDAQMQRRVSFHRNILIGHEGVYNSTRSIKHTRSLLYVGPHIHHPLPFCLTFDLLRVLDAFTLYFIDFPDEFLKLIHLTYLSLTFNDDIPPEIAKLQNLQVFMVRRQPKIIFVGVSFLPDEIWEMPNLRHLWFTETDFPPLPPRVSENRVLLLNLQTLANVNAAFFTDEVLDNMPNVKKLSMWIEGPEEIKFDLTKLSKLEFFKFVVLNPIPGERIKVKKEKFFAKTVRRLHLRGTGLPWDYMKYAAENLENLEVLKLKELAFDGENWVLDYDLEQLKYLLIEYLEFSMWEASNSNFPKLQKLIVKNCYKLEEIPEDFQYIGPLELMEMVDCSPDAVASLEDLKEKLGENSSHCQVNIFSSWK